MRCLGTLKLRGAAFGYRKTARHRLSRVSINVLSHVDYVVSASLAASVEDFVLDS